VRLEDVLTKLNEVDSAIPIYVDLVKQRLEFSFGNWAMHHLHAVT